MTYFDRCITCKRFRQAHTQGEDTPEGWICVYCIRMREGDFD